jgi:chromosome segregation ATPase
MTGKYTIDDVCGPFLDGRIMRDYEIVKLINQAYEAGRKDGNIAAEGVFKFNEECALENEKLKEENKELKDDNSILLHNGRRYLNWRTYYQSENEKLKEEVKGLEMNLQASLDRERKTLEELADWEINGQRITYNPKETEDLINELKSQIETLSNDCHNWKHSDMMARQAATQFIQEINQLKEENEKYLIALTMIYHGISEIENANAYVDWPDVCKKRKDITGTSQKDSNRHQSQ